MPKEKINKTNACRILDQKKIAYELIPYEVDENDLGAQHIADQLGEDIDQVFKTLVLKGDKIGYFVCYIIVSLRTVNIIVGLFRFCSWFGSGFGFGSSLVRKIVIRLIVIGTAEKRQHTCKQDR